VKAVLYVLGRLNVTYEIIVPKLKFYKRLYFKSGFLHDVFWAALLSDRSDDCLSSVFMPLHVAIDSVYSRFMIIFMCKFLFLSVCIYLSSLSTV